MTETGWFGVAVALYVAALGVALPRWGSGRLAPSRVQFALMLGGWCAHTGGLVTRAMQTGHCPIGQLYEVVLFVAWAVGLAYVLVGPLYRMTVLGMLTSPLLILLIGSAWLIGDSHGAANYPPGLALELHASLAVLAYGMDGLAAMAGVGLLAQDFCLRSKRWSGPVMALPPLTSLGQVQRRLMVAGSVLLVSSIVVSRWVPGIDRVPMLLWFGGVLAGYVAVIWLGERGRLSLRQSALASLLLFGLLLAAFGTVKQLQKETAVMRVEGA